MYDSCVYMYMYMYMYMYYKVAKIFVVHVVDSWVVAMLGCLGTWVVYTIHVECLS